jgi:Flp pilus assembly CpaF family ATPase
MPGWDVAKWTWENRESILAYLGRIFKWFRGSKKSAGILVVGAGGTGKTTLAQLLSGTND